MGPRFGGSGFRHDGRFFDHHRFVDHNRFVDHDRFFFHHQNRFFFGFKGPLETDEAASGMFGRKGVLNLDGFEGSGADWLERFKPSIQDGKTIVVAPHRVFGPETNDLVLQLRKRKISKIILGGMLANMCVESHLRELLEQGFEIAVAKDATAAPKHPEWGYGYMQALINYAFLAHAVLTTDQAIKAMEHDPP
jgi:nicotinamidase-related amidase